jgi:hypothetical protein
MHASTKVFIGLAFLILVVIIPVYAQTPSQLYASTNKMTYQPGDKVIITGSVPQIVNDNPATIIVRNPIGNVYEVGQVKLLNKIFVHDFVLNDDALGGVYVINVKYGDRSFQTQFSVNAGQLTLIPVLNNQIKVRTNGTELIQYDNVRVSTESKTITISMNSSALTGNKIMQEYQIPKVVIDYPGQQLIVKVDGNQITCTRTETSSERILDCLIPANSKEIQFVGSIVIPEFGPVVSIVMFSALFASVLVSKFKLRKK